MTDSLSTNKQNTVNVRRGRSTTTFLSLSLLFDSVRLPLSSVDSPFFLLFFLFHVVFSPLMNDSENAGLLEKRLAWLGRFCRYFAAFPPPAARVHRFDSRSRVASTARIDRVYRPSGNTTAHSHREPYSCSSVAV